MQATANAMQVDRNRIDQRRWRQAATQSVQCQRDLIEFDKSRTGHDRVPPYDHRGTIIVASAWLAFYIITAIYHFISSSN